MRTIAGSEQLQLAGRADHTYITTFPGEKLDHEYDLCVTDVCPVGAMTAKYFRFQKRVWLLSHTPTISMDDSLGANIWLDHADGHIYRVMPRCNPEVNRSWLSNTSRLAFQNFDKNPSVIFSQTPTGTSAKCSTSSVSCSRAIRTSAAC